MAGRVGDAFELRVFPHGAVDFGVELTQESNGDGMRRVVRCWGAPLEMVTDHILDVLKAVGYRHTDLKRTRGKPFTIPETSGVRLGLLLLAVKPLRKVRRIDDVSEAVRGLADDEVFYWYAKTTDRHHGRRAQRAFRDLVSDR